MAIVKLSKSGKGVVFIDDFGNVYTTSLTYMTSLLSGRMKAPFSVLTRMPMPTELGRFEMSSVLGKDGEKYMPEDPRWSMPQCSHNVLVDRGNEAGMDVKQMRKKEVEKHMEDKVVW